jgi:lambda family phage minor tail protein L
MMTSALSSEIQSLSPSAVIELFVLDASAIGGDIFRFHAGTNALRGKLIWQAKEYLPFPVQVSGFEFSGTGQLPRPKIVVANLTGVMTTLLLELDDLLGAKFTRKRTLAKFLDAANFPSGSNPTADPTAEFADDIFFVDRKISENRDIVEFELASSFDLQGVKLPRRQIIQNICPWKYRGAECGYTGSSSFDANDIPVGSIAQDTCGKRLSSCKARFGQNAELPFGGFPAAGLIR